jgi:hypothetical protein
MIWTVPFGQGRVVMTTLGHDLLAMTQPGFIQLFTRGAEWAATGSVNPPNRPASGGGNPWWPRRRLRQRAGYGRPGASLAGQV